MCKYKIRHMCDVHWSLTGQPSSSGAVRMGALMRTVSALGW